MSQIKNPTIKAATIFALVIVIAYSPVIFLGQSYNQSTSIPPQFIGYSGKDIPFTSTLDTDGCFIGIWPIMKLESKQIFSGIIPLWNPYLAGGMPLAANPDQYIFSPLSLGYLLPVQLWDIPLLAGLWVAGIFTFLFLRNLGLRFRSSIIGGIFYMLSGIFTWYLPAGNFAATIFTPFILYSLEKTIQYGDLKYISLSSIAFSLAILGAHIESVIFQIILAVTYLGYRICFITLSRRAIKETDGTDKKQNLLYKSSRRILASTLALLGGLGLSSFFIVLVGEFLANAAINHDTLTGISLFQKPIVLSSSFIPYVLGQMHTSWGWPVHGISEWTNPWGYVGTFALFFSIMGVYLGLKNKVNLFRKYTPIFFLSLSVFFIMKTVNVPLVNLIGYLPVLQFVDFTRYTGVIIPFGFAVAAAFGIDELSITIVKARSILMIFIISITSLFLTLIPLIPYIISPIPAETVRMGVNEAFNYATYQIAQSVLFLVIGFFLCLGIIKNKNSFLGIVSVIILELSLYVPVGLSPNGLIYKGIVTSFGMIFITLLVLIPNRFAWNLDDSHKKIKYYPIFGIIVLTIAGSLTISYISPIGMMKAHDSFGPDPVTDFLKENLGQYRIFSYNSLIPNYPAAYEIQSLGFMSAYSIDSFYSFKKNFFEQGDQDVRFGYPIPLVSEYFPNKKYFDFLGVKYVLSGDTDLNSFETGPPTTATFTNLASKNDTVGESFVSPYDKIYAFRVGIGTYGYRNNGNVILTIESIPADAKYHRESIVNAQNLNDSEFNVFKIYPPIIDATNKTFYFSIHYTPTEVNDRISVFTYDKTIFSQNLDRIRNDLKGEFFENKVPVNEREMAFSYDIHNETLVFKFHNIHIYESKSIFPRAFLVNNFQMADSYESAQNMIKNSNFDLQHQVILETPLSKDQSDLIKSSVLDNNSKVEIISYDANKVTIHTSSNEPSLLVFTDTYYPGWKGFVDGTESPIHRADGLVRAIFVPAGNHIVEFSYLPKSFTLGVSISFITATILLSLIILSNRKIIFHNNR
jgi:hypothetical protein